MSPSVPRPGDVYAWWLAPWQVEVPLQVVAVDDARARFVVLDRLAAGPLELAHVRAARPLCLTHCYWSGQVVGGELELPLPGELRPLGALPRRKLRVERNCAGLAELAGLLGYHCWWRSLPDATKAAYARASDALVRLPGWMWGERPVALPTTTERFLDGSATPGPQASLWALTRLPRLCQLVLTSWWPEVTDLVAHHRLICELVLGEHGQVQLDLTHSSLLQLTVDSAGLQRLRLPSSLNSLFLRGPVEPALRVEAAAAGSWLDLTLNSSPRPVAGLTGVRALKLHFTAPVSLAALPAAFPQLERLTLIGPRRLVTEREALAALPACQVQAFGEE